MSRKFWNRCAICGRLMSWQECYDGVVTQGPLKTTVEPPDDKYIHRLCYERQCMAAKEADAKSKSRVCDAH